MIWNEVVCLGDSLTYGARDEYGRSYPLELAKVLTERTGEFYVCHNYGVNGETSSDLLRRSWHILSTNKSAKLALLMIGTNDTKKPIPIPIYQDNLRQLIGSIKANGQTPIVATLPALHFSPYYQKNREYVQKYSEEILTMSKSLNFATVDMSNMERFLVDGVHFTNAGNKEIASRFADKILSLA